MAGFDGYPIGDSRNNETSEILNLFANYVDDDYLLSVTPTTHSLNTASIYGRL